MLVCVCVCEYVSECMCVCGYAHTHVSAHVGCGMQKEPTAMDWGVNGSKV